MMLFLSTIHVVVCVLMIFVILLQPGKDAGMGAALGGGAATSAFGGRGAVTFLSKVTGAFAVTFFVTSLSLSFVGLKTSFVEDLAKEEAAKAGPATTPAADQKAAPTGILEEGKPTAGEAPEKKPDGTEAVPAEKLDTP